MWKWIWVFRWTRFTSKQHFQPITASVNEIFITSTEKLLCNAAEIESLKQRISEITCFVQIKKLDQISKRISLILADRETKWHAAQEVKLRERLEMKLKKLKKANDYTIKLLKDFEPWGGPASYADELHCTRTGKDNQQQILKTDGLLCPYTQSRQNSTKKNFTDKRNLIQGDIGKFNDLAQWRKTCKHFHNCKFAFEWQCIEIVINNKWEHYIYNHFICR